MILISHTVKRKYGRPLTAEKEKLNENCRIVRRQMQTK